jgi:pyrophosphatase PpaX
VNRHLPAVIFDMDGTLLDSIELIVEGMVYAYDGREGPRPTRAEWKALIGTPLDTMLARWSLGEDDVQFLRGRYREFQLREHDRLVRLYPGVEQVLRDLHYQGHPLAIVSSKLQRGIRKSMDHYGLTPLFDVLVGLEQTTQHKPHPEPVLYALEKLDVAAKDALFVGDSPHDVEAGNGAGVTTVAVPWGAYSRNEIDVANPAMWIENISELSAIVAKHAK